MWMEEGGGRRRGDWRREGRVGRRRKGGAWRGRPAASQGRTEEEGGTESSEEEELTAAQRDRRWPLAGATAACGGGLAREAGLRGRWSECEWECGSDRGERGWWEIASFSSSAL